MITVIIEILIQYPAYLSRHSSLFCSLRIKMLQSRSCTFKIMQDQAHKDRQISNFPNPYRINATPYPELDFSPAVKEICQSNRYVLSGLRISKAIILGDVATGKTSLVNRFCHEIFDSNYKATIGVDFEVERFDILNSPFNLQIWDTAGQERFKSIASSYYRGAHVIIIVFDMSNLISLLHCSEWKREAMMVNNSSAHIFLVGTKRDLLRTQKGFLEIESKGINVAAEIGAELWCVSSRTGERVTEMFQRIATLAFNSIILRDQEETRQIALGSSLMSVKTPKVTQRTKCMKCN